MHGQVTKENSLRVLYLHGKNYFQEKLKIMPLNKNALARMRVIDECLKRRSVNWTWERLADACWEKLSEFDYLDRAPSRETIMADLKTMRVVFEAPIPPYDRSRGTYYYSDPDFSLFNHPLTQDDVSELRFALEVIRQFKGFKKLEGIESIITKLQHLLSLTDADPHPIVLFEHSLNEAGQRWLDDLFNYIRDKRVLRIEYQPFNETEPRTCIVSPYFLKEYNNRWFLMGFDHQLEQFQLYGLDRIRELQKELIPFIENQVVDPTTYFRDIIGVTRLAGQEKVKVTLKVIKNESPYLQTKALHESQVLLKETPEYDLYAIEVIPNVELEMKLLALGDWVTVQTPLILRNQLKKRIQKMIDNYKGK
jgi:predicted DNA-binding transcriptional regulator YafY